MVEHISGQGAGSGEEGFDASSVEGAIKFVEFLDKQGFSKCGCLYSERRWIP